MHSFPAPLPPSQPATALARGRKHIDPGPDFSGRAPVQMLMRPEVVVDRSNLLQGSITRCRIVDHVVPQQSFDRVDQPLDQTVLPGAARLAVLQANAQEAQREAGPSFAQGGHDAGRQLLPGLCDCTTVFGVQMSDGVVYETLVDRGQLGEAYGRSPWQPDLSPVGERDI